MSRQRTNIEMVSRERENIFDDYYNLIESRKLYILQLQEGYNLPDYETLIKALTILERNVDDLASTKNLGERKFQSVNDLLILCLKDWLKLFELLIAEREFVNAFSYNTLALAILIAQSHKIELLDFNRDIYYLSPSRKDLADYYELSKSSTVNSDKGTYFSTLIQEFSYKLFQLSRSSNLKKKELLRQLSNIYESFALRQKLEPDLEFSIILANQININFENKIFPFINFSSLKDLDDQDIEAFRKELNNNDIHSIIEYRRWEEGMTFEWDLEVVIKGNSFNAAQIGFLMWSLASALEAIDGVRLNLEDWGNGSKRFNLKIYIRDLLAKEEVKQVLDKSRNALESKYLDAPIEQVEKSRAEKAKTIKETENLRSKEDAKRFNELEVKEKEIEIMNKAADLALKKLEVIRGLSALIKEGIIKSDSDFEILINSLLFIERRNGQIFIGKNINLIEEKEIKNLESDQNKITEEDQI